MILDPGEYKTIGSTCTVRVNISFAFHRFVAYQKHVKPASLGFDKTMNASPIRILGVDPGLRHTGWGVISVDGPRIAWIGHGVIRPSTDAPMGERLAAIIQGLNEVVENHAPNCAAVEETFVNQNPKSTLLLGQARGAAMAGLSMAGLQVAEYAARKVKQCIVGHGAADKDQIGFMIARLLPKAGKMSEDSADALAVAITHANNLPAQGRIKKAASHSMIMNSGTIQTGKSGKKASA